MQKGDIITGQVQLASREVKCSKKGQPFTGVKVDGGWFQVWGDHTHVAQGKEVELEVSWAPENGPVFCVLSNNGSQPSQDAPTATAANDGNRRETRELVKLRNLLSEALEIAARLEANEATQDDPPPEGIPF